MPQQESSDNGEPRFDRREALWGAGALALGGVLGSLMSLAGCRAPQVYRDFPAGSPTGYLIDPAFCTRCGDCLRVCRCDAVAGHPTDPAQCWIIIDKCCACGRCYRVCDVAAIVPTYGPQKTPPYEIKPWKAGDPYGYKVSPIAAPHCKHQMTGGGAAGQGDTAPVKSG